MVFPRGSYFSTILPGGLMATHELPTPGPGRPHHPSFSQPGPLMSLRGFAIVALAAAALNGLAILSEVVSG